jgi:hypothetical protein
MRRSSKYSKIDRIVYRTTNNVNNKIYIGQDYFNDSNYYGSGTIFKKALNKYGKENFTKETLCYCSSDLELDEMETFWINELDAANKTIGYNIVIDVKSPMRGRHHSEETKKLSESQEGEKGYWYGKQPLLGFNHSTQTKSVLSKKFSKKILQYSLDGILLKEWNSAFDVQRTLLLGKSTIGKCCRGIYKHAYGYIWKFKHD